MVHKTGAIVRPDWDVRAATRDGQEDWGKGSGPEAMKEVTSLRRMDTARGGRMSSEEGA
jgi:hypothetical protein